MLALFWKGGVLLIVGNIVQWYQSYLNVQVIRNFDSNTIYKTLKDYYHINALGYSTKNFQSSEAIVFVEKGSTHTITLTAYWTGHADVITKESDPSICDVTFAATSWERSVDVKIEGKKIGTTMVTFQNSSDNRSFSIAVVVVRP